MSKKNRFRAAMLIDILIEDSDDTDLVEQKMLAVIEANEIKHFLESKGYTIKVQDVFSNPLGSIIDE